MPVLCSFNAGYRSTAQFKHNLFLSEHGAIISWPMGKEGSFNSWTANYMEPDSLPQAEHWCGWGESSTSPDCSVGEWGLPQPLLGLASKTIDPMWYARGQGPVEATLNLFAPQAMCAWFKNSERHYPPLLAVKEEDAHSTPLPFPSYLPWYP